MLVNDIKEFEYLIFSIEFNIINNMSQESVNKEKIK